MPSGKMDFSEDCLFSVQMKVPLAFYLNLFFGIADTQICPLTVSDFSILHIFHKSITTPPISEFRCYGLCRALLPDNT